MLFADFLTHCHHDAFPADHGAQAQSNRHRDLDPGRNKFGRAVEGVFIQLKRIHIGFDQAQTMILIDQAQGFSGQIHIVADIARGIRRYRVDRTETGHVNRDLPDQIGQGHSRHRCRLRFMEKRRDGRTRVGNRGLLSAQHNRLVIEHRGSFFRVSRKMCDFRGRNRVIQGIYRRHRADQDQHDQAHAFLTIIRTMSKTDAGAGQDQQQPDPERWRLIALGRFIQSRDFNQGLGQQQ